MLRDEAVDCSLHAAPGCAPRASIRQVSSVAGKMTMLDHAGRVWVAGETTARRLPEASQLSGLCVVTTRREVWCDRLDKRRAPARAGSISDAVEVAASSTGEMLIRRAAGRVVIVRKRGEITPIPTPSGSPTAITDAVSTAVRVVGVHDAIAISTGPRRACAVERSGEVVCWGDPDPTLPPAWRVDQPVSVVWR